MSLLLHFYFAVLILTLRCASGSVSVSISSEPEEDPAGVFQAATPVTLTCTHNGSSSATYSWTCSGESNCFTQGLTEPSKRRGILRGGDTGTHTCTVSDLDGKMIGTALTTITVTGIGFSYRRLGSIFHYVANNSAIFIPASSTLPDTYILADLECASGTTSQSPDKLLFLTPNLYEHVFNQVYEPGHWKLQSPGGIYYFLPSFSGGVFTCRMPDESGTIVDTSVGIYPNNYDINSLSVSLSYNQNGLSLILTCISSGLPPTTITWSKDGVEMSSGDKYTVCQRVIDVDNIVYENTFVMSGDSESDMQGLYQCTVQCYDDYGLLISNASATTSLIDPAGDTVSSTQSISSSSSASSSLAIVSTTNTSMNLITTTKRSGFSIPVLITSFSSTCVFTTSTFNSSTGNYYTSTGSFMAASLSSQTSPTTTSVPTKTPFLRGDMLYAIIAFGTALFILLLLCIFIGCWCFCVRQRRNTWRNQECDEMKDVSIQKNMAYSNHSIAGQGVSQCSVQDREYEPVDIVSCKQKVQQSQSHIYEYIKN